MCNITGHFVAQNFTAQALEVASSTVCQMGAAGARSALLPGSLKEFQRP